MASSVTLNKGSVRIFILYITLTSIAACSVFKRQQSVDDEILTTILANRNQQDGFTVIEANASISVLGQSERFLESTCQHISKKINNKDIDVCSLLQRLIKKNKDQPPLTIESNRSAGYLIDKSGRFSNYFSEDGGGWDLWYKENPEAKCLTTVSLPVLDEQTKVVAIYIGTRCHWRVGEGSFVIFAKDGGKYVERYRVRLWVS